MPSSPSHPNHISSPRATGRVLRLSKLLIGKTIYVNREPSVVVGVTPPGISWRDRDGATEVTLPIRMRQRLERDPHRPSGFEGSDRFWVQTMRRLKPGVDLRTAHAELSNLLIASLPESAIGDRSAGLPKLVMEPGFWVSPEDVRGSRYPTI